MLVFSLCFLLPKKSPSAPHSPAPRPKSKQRKTDLMNAVVLTIKHIRVFRSFLNLVKESVENLCIKIVKNDELEGFEVVQMDRFRVSAIVANIECGVEGVSASSGGDAFVTFSASKAHKILEKVMDENSLEVIIPKHAVERKIFFVEKNPLGNGFVRKRETDAVEDDVEMLNIPSIDYPTKLQISLSELRKSISEGLDFKSETIQILIERASFGMLVANKITIKTAGDINSFVEYLTVHDDEEDSENIVIDESTKNREIDVQQGEWATIYDFTFGLKFFAPLVKLDTQDLVLFFAKDSPLRIHYPIDKVSFVSLFVGPKVGDDE